MEQWPCHHTKRDLHCLDRSLSVYILSSISIVHAFPALDRQVYLGLEDKSTFKFGLLNH